MSSSMHQLIGTVAPATPNYAGPIRVEIWESETIHLLQSEDGYRDMIGIQLPKIDELIALLQTAKTKLLSAGHGAQREAATALDNPAHETPGRQLPQGGAR